MKLIEQMRSLPAGSVTIPRKQPKPVQNADGTYRVTYLFKVKLPPTKAARLLRAAD